VVAGRPTDPLAQRRHDRVVRRGADLGDPVFVAPRHHQGSREAITLGRGPKLASPAEGEPLGPHESTGAQLVGLLVGAEEVGGDDVGAEEVGGALDVGGALVVGAAEVVRWVGGGGGGAGEWPVSGGVPVTFAGGGKVSTGVPTRSRFITAAQVAVG
jgi:hypothetical protein